MNNKFISRKKLLVILPMVTVVILASSIFAIRTINKGATDKQTWDNTDSLAETPQEDTSSPKTVGNKDEEDKHTPVQYEGESVNNSGRLTGVINYKSVVDDTLILRVTIDQPIHEGVCKITLLRDSDKKMVTRDADIIQNPSSASCSGFDIPLSELGSGNWKIKVDLNDNKRSGTIEESISL